MRGSWFVVAIVAAGIGILVAACGSKTPAPLGPPQPGRDGLRLAWYGFRIIGEGAEPPDGTHHSARIRDMDGTDLGVHHYGILCEYVLELTSEQRFTFTVSYRDGNQPAKHEVVGEWQESMESMWELAPDCGFDVLDEECYWPEDDERGGSLPRLWWCPQFQAASADGKTMGPPPSVYSYQAPTFDRESGRLRVSFHQIDDPRRPSGTPWN